MALRTEVGGETVNAGSVSVVAPIEVAGATGGTARTAAASGAVEHGALVLAPRAAKPKEARAQAIAKAPVAANTVVVAWVHRKPIHGDVVGTR